MLPSVKELLAFGRHMPPAHGARLPYARERTRPETTALPWATDLAPVLHSAGSSPRGDTAAAAHHMQMSASKQRPGRKAGSGDRYSASSGARQYRCGVHSCAVVFKRPEHLKRHMLTHTQLRPFRCDARGCGKRFSRRDNYTTHIKKHETELCGPLDGPGAHGSQPPLYCLSNKQARRSDCDSPGGSSAGSTRAGTPQPDTVSSGIQDLPSWGSGGALAAAGSDSASAPGAPAAAQAVEHLPAAPAAEHSRQGPAALRPLDLLALASIRAQPSSDSGPPSPSPSPRHSALAPPRHSPTAVDNMASPAAGAAPADPTKPFACSLCDSRFGRMEHVKRHLLVHTGERHYECTVCSKPFARRDNMVQHQRSHRHKASDAA